MPPLRGVLIDAEQRGAIVDLRMGKSDSVEYIQARDGRVDTQAERDYLARGYRLDIEKERHVKAEVVPPEAPIQIVLLNREQGAVVRPHWHPLDRRPVADAKQQLILCQRGSVRASVWTKEGEHLGDRILREDDMILFCEGHGFAFLEPDTKAIEIRMGPHAGVGQETRPLY